MLSTKFQAVRQNIQSNKMTLKLDQLFKMIFSMKICIQNHDSRGLSNFSYYAFLKAVDEVSFTPILCFSKNFVQSTLSFTTFSNHSQSRDENNNDQRYLQIRQIANLILQIWKQKSLWQLRFLLALTRLLFLHCLFLRERLVDLLHFAGCLSLQDIACLTEDNFAVLQEVDLMAQRLEDCEDEVEHLDRRVLEVFYLFQHLPLHAVDLLQQTFDDRCLLRTVDVFVEHIVEDDFDRVLGALKSYSGSRCYFSQGFFSGTGILQLFFKLELVLLQRLDGNILVDFLIDFVLLIEDFDAEIIMKAELPNCEFDLLVHTHIDDHCGSFSRAFLSWGHVLDTEEALPKKVHLVRAGDIPVFVGKLSDEGIEAPLLLEYFPAFAVGLILGGNNSDLFLKDELGLVATVAIVLRSYALQERILAIEAFLCIDLGFVDHGGNNYKTQNRCIWRWAAARPIKCGLLSVESQWRDSLFENSLVRVQGARDQYSGSAKVQLFMGCYIIEEIINLNYHGFAVLELGFRCFGRWANIGGSPFGGKCYSMMNFWYNMEKPCFNLEVNEIECVGCEQQTVTTKFNPSS